MRKFAVLTGAVLTTVATMLFASPASAEPETSPAEPGTHCTILVSKARDAEGNSIVLDHWCGPSTNASKAAQSALKSSTGLVQWFTGAGYTGTSTTIAGSDGPCDGFGYRLNTGSYWAYRITGITPVAGGNCGNVNLKSLQGVYSGYHSIPWSFGSTSFNNNVSQMQVVS